MDLQLERFFNRLRTRPQHIEFPDVVALINRHYEFVPTAFRNGDLINEAGQNNGSCRLFAFGKLHELNEAEMLACFGAYYRADVLKTPQGDSHPNIRQFMQSGWRGVEFMGVPLRARRTPLDENVSR